MSWTNDGLTLFYGTDKAIPTTAGDYMSYGENRTAEVTINIADLTTTNAIVVGANTTWLAAGMIVDSVIVEATTVVTGITSLSVGLTKDDRTTSISDTALVAAIPIANLNVAGETTVLTGGVTYAGTVVGTTVGADNGYFSAKIAGSAGTGIVKVLVKYRGVPPITH